MAADQLEPAFILEGLSDSTKRLGSEDFSIHIFLILIK